jgi:hypothetical protein
VTNPTADIRRTAKLAHKTMNRAYAANAVWSARLCERTESNGSTTNG